MGRTRKSRSEKSLKLAETQRFRPRRSKRLWYNDVRRRFKAGLPFQSLTFSYLTSFLRRGRFPLVRLLQLATPVRDHLLPYLSLNDLANLELVSKDCFNAVRDGGFWRKKLFEYVDQDYLAGNVFSKYTLASQTEQENPLYFRRAYSKLKSDLDRLKHNVDKGSYKESSMYLPSDCNSISTNFKNKVVFAAGENQVDIFNIVETRKGANLKLWGHLNWDGQLPNYEGVDDNATHAFLAKNFEDWVFVAHYDGLITVWNWRIQVMVDTIGYHLQLDNDLDHYYDIPVITAMEVKQNRIIVGQWGPQPVTIWDFQPLYSRIELIAEINLTGYSNVHAVDIDGQYAVIAFDRSPQSIHQICIYDLNQKAVLRFFTAPDVKTLSLNTKQGGLLAGSTRTEASAPVLQLFDIHGGLLCSYKTERGDPSNREIDILEDFFLDGGACVWSDWKDKIVLGYTNGTIAIYDFMKETPICCIKRKRFNESFYPCWIKDISFDGAYLIFNHETDVCLFDFLKLTSPKL